MIGSMQWRLSGFLCLVCAVVCLAVPRSAMAAESHGQVTFHSMALPGATVTATQDGKKSTTVTDELGLYSFADLPDGPWTITVEMVGFTTMKQDVSVAAGATATAWELKMLSLDAMIAQTKMVKVDTAETPVAAAAPAPGTAAAPAKKAAAAAVADAPKPAEDSAQSAQANDGFLVNGSVNNAATSQFTLAPAFGNNRSGSKSLYNGNLVLILDNSTFDARPYSLTPFNTPKAAYNKVTGGFTFGGPLNIPRLMPHGPNFTVSYQWTHNHLANTQSVLVPTAALGTPIPGSVAAHLLTYYPAPTPGLVGNPQYNYQTSVLSNTHQDQIQIRMDKTIDPKNQVYGNFAFQSIRSNSGSIFINPKTGGPFVDTTDNLGFNMGANWNHRFNQRLFMTLGFQVNRYRTEVRPYFEDRDNVSAEAGIVNGRTTTGGNDQDRAEWGPPTLNFSGPIVGLSDVNSAFNRNRQTAFSAVMHYYRGHHNFTFGGDFKRQEYNVLAQQNPRGTFTFTGASAFTHFLQDMPDSSSIAYGNADKYYRQSIYDAYLLDDWRIRPELTINLGLRWEYGAPITELKGRLVNLNVGPGFSTVTPVCGANQVNSAMAQICTTNPNFPSSLIRPDKMGIEPRIGISWRPIPGSSVIVKAGYGVYDDTSVYLATASKMAQQAPLSTSGSYSNTSCAQEIMESGFKPCSTISAFSFGVDPKFRVGYAQTWQLSVQRDLPAALQMTVTYNGIKGTRGVQQYLPNTFAPGGTAPTCPATPCSSGFTYQSSNGNSTREAGSIQLRRRLRSGFTATVQYTFAKGIDDDSAMGGQGGPNGQSFATPAIAQNWLNLQGERSLSSTDQRHLLNVTAQYTTGMGLGGGSLMGGWRGRAYKEWTFVTTINAGSGLPETPIYFATVMGSSVTGTIRPSLTGAPVVGGSGGAHLNVAAYQSPQLGQWGGAGRNSITGPAQFSLNATMSRTFHVNKRYSLDIQLAATNLLNHAAFTSWNTTLSPCNATTDPASPTDPNPTCASPAGQAPGTVFTPNANPRFGLPASANAMRSMQLTARLRF